MKVQRGQVWRYQGALARAGQSQSRLIVSAQPINDNEELSVVLGLQVFDQDPGGLLAVSLGELGWTSAMTVQPVVRSRLTELLKDMPAEIMDLVDAALRTAQHL